MPIIRAVIPTDLYYFFIEILYRVLDSYFYHVATDKHVNIPTKWWQVLLNSVDGQPVVVNCI